MVDNVDDATKHRRFDELLKVIEEGVVYHSEKMIGKTYAVLVDGPSKKNPEVLSGYTETGKLVHFEGPNYLKGSIVNVYIEESHAFSMKGRLIDDPIIVLAKLAASRLSHEKEAVRYLECKAAFENDENVKKLLSSIEETQKSMVSLAAKNEQEAARLAKEKYDALMDEYLHHPVVMNLRSAIDELEALLSEVEGMLS